MSKLNTPRHRVVPPRALNYSYYYRAEQQSALKEPVRQPLTETKSKHTRTRTHRPTLIVVALLLIGITVISFVSDARSNQANKTAVKGAQTIGNLTTSDPKSINVVINKSHPLSPKNYAPADLTTPNVPMRANISEDESKVSKQIAPDLELLISAAANNGIQLELESGYRSYAFQVNLYNYYVSAQGQETADEQSARPGYSEHQTGFAVDLGSSTDTSCNVQLCFGNTAEGNWLAANAYKYGFIVRYSAADQALTGYEPEAWHFRYVGQTLAKTLKDKNITTLEEYFNISGGTVYKN